ncbi:hypothetical protein [Cognatiluteimonas lumbrici]|uniref:hypothetical protein n=1 Tax=Cognatiluteimonas lumbrici TaxID=2559601 RepID=UPI00112B74E1|nr:hypothetical protein [Luteimonas lumbrici]
MQTSSTTHRTWIAIAGGGLAIGTLDLAFATLYWMRHDIAPVRILQSIATGWLGDAAYAGGSASAWLGAVSHYLIATTFVAAYHAAARHLPRLLDHPLRYGIAYGAWLYIAMNFIVLPLSAAGSPGFGNRAWVASSILAHLVFGVMSALSARLAAGRGISGRRRAPSAR